MGYKEDSRFLYKFDIKIRKGEISNVSEFGLFSVVDNMSKEKQAAWKYSA